MSEREYGCDGKVRFADFGIAQKAAGRRPGRQAYRCRFCDSFHVGTKPGGKSSAKRRRK